MLHSAPRVEEIETLKASLTATSSGSDELNKKIAEKEAVIVEKAQQAEQLKEALQEQVALLQTKEALLAELHKTLTERSASLEDTKVHLKAAEAQSGSLKEQVARVSQAKYNLN